MEQHLGASVDGRPHERPLVWVAQPPLEEALMTEARWFGGYALHCGARTAGVPVRLALAPHCPHRARPPAHPSLPRAEVHYRWNGLIAQQHEHALYWFGDWERENASSLLFLRARPSSPLEERSVAGGTARGGWRCERLFELPRPAPGEVSPSWPRTVQQPPEADSDNREEEEEASAVVLTSTSRPDRAVVVGSDGLGHLFVADVGRGEEAAEPQAAVVEGGAGRVVVYEDLVCPSPGEEGGALVPRPFVVVAAALYPGDRELLALAYYMTPSPATAELQQQPARWHHHLVLLSVHLPDRSTGTQPGKVAVVERLVGLHRPYSASFVADARGIPSSFVLVSEGVFGRSIDAVARFIPGRPAISPLVQLPGDPSQPSHPGFKEQPDEEEDEEVRVPTAATATATATATTTTSSAPPRPAPSTPGSTPPPRPPAASYQSPPLPPRPPGSSSFILSSIPAHLFPPRLAAANSLSRPPAPASTPTPAPAVAPAPASASAPASTSVRPVGISPRPLLPRPASKQAIPASMWRPLAPPAWCARCSRIHQLPCYAGVRTTRINCHGQPVPSSACWYCGIEGHWKTECELRVWHEQNAANKRTTDSVASTSSTANP